MTKKINRILCSIGMRGNCDNVLEHSVNLALATGASLNILYVVKSLADDVMNTLKVNIRDRDVLGSLMEKRIDQSRSELAAEVEAFWGRFPELREAMQGREVTLSVLEGYPAAVIAHCANAGKYDLIVMAANKRSYLATYAGKVTKGVIKRSKVPVVVVPVARP
ncbi:universal stress protein [Pseudomonas sp. C27(2019)]|uniref:universal stress protein n=1 Tax=Pseudomonas sp. C27(2019) TaxID=2604941 RepID=UPI001244F48F|nr:universal stress protein [Pseudomonas sp. C27(2019)]QEY60291.1 universal stress protein [Pseudomonas sp. C27(2019)]